MSAATTGRSDTRGGIDPEFPGPEGAARRARLQAIYLLRWIYIARMTLATGILLGAFLAWEQAEPGRTLVATVLFLSVLAATGLGAWHTHVKRRDPGRTFLFAQLAFDACMVTAIVHVTGGVSSIFMSLYIPLIGLAAVILPAPGVALIGGLSAIFYVAEAVWWQGMDVLSGQVLLQVVLFCLVAVITGILGDRLRRTGVALGRVESELLRLRLDTSDILASVTSGILTVDWEGRMIYLNPAGESLLGIDANRWTGRPALGRVSEVAPELSGLFRRSLREGRSLFRKTVRVARNQERLVLGVTTTVRDADGEPRAVTAVFQDITDQERLALLNRQNERLEAVAELAASMAHEIRNPMASIRSAVEQFASPRITEPDRAALSRMVVRESERLSRLLSDFIDFARVRVGETGSVDLSEVIEEVVGVVRQHPETERRGLVIESRLPSAPARLVGDGDVLYRAVLNLVLNAVQFSPEGEKVEVSLVDAGDVEDAPSLGVENPLCVRVRDHGKGIPQDDLGRLFDPFFTTRKEGSGLGLAMVHRAVEAHRGAIVVEHPDGGGAEFILYLPGGAGMPLVAEVNRA